tara:strand:+ start:385 stop:675 length:291 start_codon:yes stop_codon:yes gene_type:complete
MKFKLFAIFFALVFSAGIISHETSHFELDHSEHVQNEHAVELLKDCSTCLAEASEFTLDESPNLSAASIFDFLDKVHSSEISLSYNQTSIRAPPNN